MPARMVKIKSTAIRATSLVLAADEVQKTPVT
jgi:hypothetical protein